MRCDGDRPGVLAGRADQGLADHILREHGRPEQLRGDLRDFFPPVGAAALGGHGGRRADAPHVRRGAGVLDPADQHRHVRALPAPVGVQLVEDQELQPLGHPDQRPPVIRAG